MEESRPFDRFLGGMAWALFIASAGVWWAQQGSLPERIPIRFDFRGTTDGWGDRSTALILFVGIGFAMGLMALISRFLPKEQMNFPGKEDPEIMEAMYTRSRTLLNGIQLSMSLLLIYILYMIWTAAHEIPDPLAPWSWAVILLIVGLPMALYFYSYIQLKKK